MTDEQLAALKPHDAPSLIARLRAAESDARRWKWVERKFRRAPNGRGGCWYAQFNSPAATAHLGVAIAIDEAIDAARAAQGDKT